MRLEKEELFIELSSINGIEEKPNLTVENELTKPIKSPCA